MIVEDRVIIEDPTLASQLHAKGYGEFINKRLELSLVEAAYLAEKKKIPYDFKEIVKHAVKIQPRFWVRYHVYRDMRERGYIVKTALKYGADFRVYERTMKEHAKWILFAVREGDLLSWYNFAAMMRVAHSVRKKLLIGVVDEEGDVTYYEVRWLRP